MVASPNKAPTFANYTAVGSLSTLGEVSGVVRFGWDSITVTDPDATTTNNNFLNGYIQATGVAGDLLSVSEHGGITISGSNISYGGNVVATISGQGSSSLRVTFNAFATTVNKTNEAAAAVMKAITYQNTNNAPVAHSITFAVNDGDSSVTSSFSTALTFTTLENDAPVVTLGASTSLTTIAEDVLTASNGGSSVTTLMSGKYSDPDGSSVTLAGIAVTANTADSGTQGVWQYLNGSTWTAIGSASDAAARTFSAATMIRFAPVANFNGTPPGLTVRVLDSTGGAITNNATRDTSTNGTTTAISANTVAIGVTVSSVNDLPVGVADVAAITANTSATTTGNVLTNDTDVETVNGSLVVSAITGGTVGTAKVGTYGSLTLGANGAYTYAVDANDADTKALANGATATDVFTYTVRDGASTTATATVTVTVTGINDAPTVGTTATVAYSENGTAVALSSAATVADVDTTNMSGASISIGSGFTSGDTLNFTNQGTITGSYNSGTGVLTLTGAATAANYQAALRTITFSSSSETLTTTPTSRAIAWTVTDSASGTSSAGSSTVTVTGVNDAPVLSAGARTLSAIANSISDVTNTGTLVSDLLTASSGTITDVDSGTLGVAITGTSVANGLGTWQYSTNGTTWTAFPASLSATNALLLAPTEHVRFVPVTGQVGSPTLTIKGWDMSTGTAHTPATSTTGNAFSANSSTVTETVLANSAPTITGASTTGTYTENGTTLVVGGSALVADTELDSGAGNYNNASLTVQRQTTANAQDVFTVTAGTDYTVSGANLVTTVGSHTFATISSVNGVGTVTFNSFATSALADDVLRHVTYSNSSDAPPGSVVLVATFNDGSSASNATTTATTTLTITAVNDAPVFGGSAAGVLTTIAEDVVTGSNPGSTITTLLGSQVTDADLTSLAGVAITANTANSSTEGVWQYQDSSNTWHDIGAASTTAAVALSAATHVRFVPVANYNGTPTALTVMALDSSYSGGYSTASEVTVNTTTAGTAVSSASVSIGVTVTAVADAPVVVADSAAAFTENGSAFALSTGLTVTDVDSTNLASATVSIGAGFTSASDSLAFSDQNGITGTYHADTGILNLTGSATLAQYQDALRSVTFVNSSDNPTSISTTRAISWTVTDSGSVTSSAGSTTLTITPVNDAPVLTPAGTAPVLSVAENAGTTATGMLVSALLGATSTDAEGGSLGIAITATSQGTGFAAGTWAYSANGTDWTAFPGGIAGASALALPGTYHVRFVPSGSGTTTADQSVTGLTFRAWESTGSVVTSVDTSGGNNGGTTAFSTATQDATLTVTFQNDAPVIVNNVALIVEETSVSNAFGTTQLSATDEENTAAANVVYTLTDDVDLGQLLLNGTRLLVNGTFTQAQVTAGNLTYDNFDRGISGTGQGSDTFKFTVAGSTTTGGAGASAEQTASITINRTNANPTAFTGTVTSATVTEQTTATRTSNVTNLFSGITLTDNDSSTYFSGGYVTVAVNAHGDSGDQLFIQDTSRIELRNTNQVFFKTNAGDSNSWTQVGTIDTVDGLNGVNDGLGGNDLRVDFNNSMTPSAAAFVLRAIGYANTSNAPNTGKTFDVVLNDGEVGQTGTGSFTSGPLAITATNDAPTVTITASGNAITFLENAINVGPATGDGTNGKLLFTGNGATIAVADPDNGNDAAAGFSYNNGSITVSGLGTDTNDIVSISSQTAAEGAIQLSGANVQYYTASAWQTIGTLAGGSGGSSLVISLNGSATQTKVDALLGRLLYSNNSDTVVGARVFTVTVNDGTANNSTVATLTVNVTAENEPPVLTGLSTSLTVAENTSNVGATSLDADNSVALVYGDAASGGHITTLVVTGGQTGDHISVAHVGTSAAQIGVSGSAISYGGTQFATMSGGTDGTALTITFDSSALGSEAARVTAIDALIERLSYQTTSDRPAASHDLIITVNALPASGSAISSSKTVTVNVTNEADAPTIATTTFSLGALDANDDVNDISLPVGLDGAQATVSSMITSAGVADGDEASYTGGIQIHAVPVGAGTWTFSTNSGTSWSALTNGQTLSSSDLVRYIPAAGAENATASLEFVGRDSGGLTSTATATASFTVAPVNDAPTMTNGDSDTVGALDSNDDAANGAGTRVALGTVADLLTGSGLHDNDSGASTGMALTGIAGDGLLEYNIGGSWVTITSVSASAALLLASDAQLRYTPALNSTTTATLTFHAWDQTGAGSNGGSVDLSGGSATGGATAYSTETVSRSWTVAHANDAPTLDTFTSDLGAIDSNDTERATAITVATLLSNAEVSDVDASASSGIAVSALSGSGTWEYNSGSGWVTFGTVSDSAARLLPSSASVRYTPALDETGSPAITFNAWDQTAGSGTADLATTGDTTAYSTASHVASFTAAPANDAPTVTTTTWTVNTGASLDSNDALGTAVDGLPAGDRVGMIDVSTLVTSAGSADADQGATLGVAITGLGGTGTWYYRATSTDAWQTMSSLSGTIDATHAVLFNASAQLAYAAGFDEEDATFTYRAWDQTTGTNGATGVNPNSSAYSSSVVTATILTAPEADNPTLTGLDGAQTLTQTLTTTTVRLDVTANTITDVDSASENPTEWNTGTLVVHKVTATEISNGALAGTVAGSAMVGDRVGVVSHDVDGTSPFFTAVSGGVHNIYYGADSSGTLIGSYPVTGAGSGGYAGSDIYDLTITFNGSATRAIIGELTAWISYGNEVDSTHLRGLNPTNYGVDGTRQFDVTLTDGDGGTTTISDVGLTVVGYNDAPVMANSTYTMTAINEDVVSASNAGTTVAALLSEDGTTHLSSAVTDADTRSVGIAITALSNDVNSDSVADGVWEVKIAGTWTAVSALTGFSSGVSATNALLLASTDEIRFNPASNFFSTGGTAPYIDFKGWDGTSGSAHGFADTTTGSGAGTEGAYSSGVGRASVTVTQVDDAPVIDYQSFSAYADTNGNPISGVTGLKAHDLDGGVAADVVYTLTTVPGRGQLVLNGEAVGVGGTFTQAQINSGALKYDSYGPEVTDDTFGYTVAGLHGVSSAPEVATINIQQNDENPVIWDFGGSYHANFTEGNASVRIDESLRVTDDDTASFANEDVTGASAYLLISHGTDGADTSHDTLSIKSTTTNNFAIRVSGTDVYFRAKPADPEVRIGTIDATDDGLTGHNLKINFSDTNGGVTALAVRILLQNLAFSVDNTGNPDTTSRIIDLKLYDGEGHDDIATLGTANSGVATATATLTVTAVNTAAVLTTSGAALTFTESQNGTDASTLAVAVNSAISIYDGDYDQNSDSALTGGEPSAVGANMSGATIQVTGNVQSGDTLSWTDTYDGISGSWNAGTHTLTLTGSDTVAHYQSALQSVKFYSNESVQNPDTGDRTVTFIVNDGTVNSAGATAAVHVATANDRPSVVSATEVAIGTVTEDQYADSAALLSGNPAGFSVATLLADGTLTAADVDTSDTAALGIAVTGHSADGTWYYKNSGSTWTAIGTVTDSSAVVLDRTASLYFVPAANYHDDNGNTYDASLTFKAWDHHDGSVLTSGTTGVNTSAGSFSSNSALATVMVTATNDAPSVADATMTTPATFDDDNNSGTVQVTASVEDAVTSSFWTVSTLFTSAFSDAAGSYYDGDALGGILIVGNTANATTQGAWQFCAANGSGAPSGNWIDVDGVSSTAGLQVVASDFLRFVPVANYAGTPPGLTVHLIDNFNDGVFSAVTGTGVAAPVTGGTTHYSSDTVELTTTIAAVNDRPTVSSTTQSLGTVNSTAIDPSGTLVSSLFGSGVRYEDVEGNTFNGIVITQNDDADMHGSWQYSTNGTSGWTSISTISSGATGVYLAANVYVRYLPGNGDIADVSLSAIVLQNSVIGGSQLPSLTTGSPVTLSTIPSDLTSNPTGGTVTLSVTPVPVDRPTFSGLTALMGLAEGASAAVIDSDATVSDFTTAGGNPATANYNGFTLSIQRPSASTEDVFGFSASGATFTVNGGGNLVADGNVFGTVTNTGNGILSIAFTSTNGTTPDQTLVNNVLEHITYRNGSASPTTSYTLRASLDDSGDGYAATTQDIAVTVTTSNDAPVVTLEDATLTTTTASAISLNLANSRLVSVADADAASADITVTINVETSGAGSLAVTEEASGGVSRSIGEIQYYDASSTALFGDISTAVRAVLTGSLTQIQNTLNAGFTFTPSGTVSGPVIVRVTANDQGNTGGSAQSSYQDITVDVKPVITASQVFTIAEGTASGVDASEASGDGIITVSGTTTGNTYAITSGDSSNWFTIDSSGHIKLTATGAANWDYETTLLADRTHTLGVTVTHGGITSDAVNVQVGLTNVTTDLNYSVSSNALTINAASTALAGAVTVNMTDGTITGGQTASAGDDSTADGTIYGASITSLDASALTGAKVVVVGSSGVDTITGSAAADTITGGRGADVINGGSGSDVINFTFGANGTNGAVASATIGLTAAEAANLGAGVLELTVDGVDYTVNIDATQDGINGSVSTADIVDSINEDATLIGLGIHAAWAGDTLTISDNEKDGNQFDASLVGAGQSDTGIAGSQGQLILLLDAGGLVFALGTGSTADTNAALVRSVSFTVNDGASGDTLISFNVAGGLTPDELATAISDALTTATVATYATYNADTGEIVMSGYGLTFTGAGTLHDAVDDGGAVVGSSTYYNGGDSSNFDALAANVVHVTFDATIDGVTTNVALNLSGGADVSDLDGLVTAVDDALGSAYTVTSGGGTGLAISALGASFTNISFTDGSGTPVNLGQVVPPIAGAQATPSVVDFVFTSDAQIANLSELRLNLGFDTLTSSPGQDFTFDISTGTADTVASILNGLTTFSTNGMSATFTDAGVGNGGTLHVSFDTGALALTDARLVVDAASSTVGTNYQDSVTAADNSDAVRGTTLETVTLGTGDQLHFSQAPTSFAYHAVTQGISGQAELDQLFATEFEHLAANTAKVLDLTDSNGGHAYSGTYLFVNDSHGGAIGYGSNTDLFIKLVGVSVTNASDVDALIS